MSRSSSAEHPRLVLDFLLKWFPGVALLAMLMLHALGVLSGSPIRQLDHWLHDQRLRAFASDVADERVAIVDIDERSLQAMGRWPWPRDRLAELVRRLFEQEGAQVVGLDLILAEADESSGLPTLQQWAEGPLARDEAFQRQLAAQRPRLDRDGQLQEVMARHPVVLGFHVTRGSSATRSGQLPPPWMAASAADGLPRFDGFGANLPRLAGVAAGGGFLDSWVDSDGVRRHAPLLVDIDGQVHAALALALTRALIGPAEVRLRREAGRLSAVDLIGQDIRLSVEVGRDASIVLPYAARGGLVPSHSALDVLEQRLPPGTLRGRLVLVGTTVPGLADRHPTPVSEQLPGVQAHATLLSAMLDRRVPTVPVWAPLAELGTLAAIWALMLPLGRFGLPAAAAWAALATAALLVGNALAWALGQVALPLAAALMLVGGLFGWRVVYGLVWERRQRQRIEALFGQYVPPELVERMSRDAQHYDMQGRNAELTVMFADLHGFTRLSESMPPAALAELMNDFFSEMAEIVLQHKGTLDKYIGDSVMAFWGAPVADPDHAQHAVQAARAMQAALPRLNRRFAQRGWPALSLGIGINSGTMVVGDLGSRHRRAYTVLGDAVNVASRLQELTGTLEVGILVGEATQARLPAGEVVHVGTASLRGRHAAVTLYTPAGAPAA